MAEGNKVGWEEGYRIVAPPRLGSMEGLDVVAPGVGPWVIIGPEVIVGRFEGMDMIYGHSDGSKEGAIDGTTFYIRIEMDVLIVFYCLSDIQPLSKNVCL